jgi:hypothetical protein
LKGSIKPTGQTLGMLFGLGSGAVNVTYGKLVLVKLAGAA